MEKYYIERFFCTFIIIFFLSWWIYIYRIIIVANLYIIFSVVRCIVTTGNSTLKDSYEEEWVVRVLGGTQVSSLLALRSGCKNLGLVSLLLL